MTLAGRANSEPFWGRCQFPVCAFSLAFFPPPPSLPRPPATNYEIIIIKKKKKTASGRRSGGERARQWAGAGGPRPAEPGAAPRGAEGAPRVGGAARTRRSRGRHERSAAAAALVRSSRLTASAVHFKMAAWLTFIFC